MLVAACVPEAKVADDSASLAADDTGGGTSGQTHAVVATTFDGVGALAVVDLDTLEVTDELASISSDAVVVVEGDQIFQPNRSDFDSVRVYAPGQFNAPVSELAPPPEPTRGTSRSATAACSSHSMKPARSPCTTWRPACSPVRSTCRPSTTGTATPRSLRPWNSVDGSMCRSSSLARDEGWAPEGGTIAEVDCTTMAVERSWGRAEPDHLGLARQR